MDDMYGVHSVKAIAEREQVAELANLVYSGEDSNGNNPYIDILADDYDSAYARRLRGFNSPTYRMPSSYYNLAYSSAMTYASAYDPAFYNVIVMGDEVWVEPRYISSMFGSWGAPSYFNFNYSFGGWYGGGMYGGGMWGYNPYSWWGYPRYSWWDWNYGYNYNPYWGGYYNPYYGPYWGGGYISYKPAHNYRLDGNSSRPSRYVAGSRSNTSRYGATSNSRYNSRANGSSAGAKRYYNDKGRSNNSSRIYRNDNSRPSYQVDQNPNNSSNRYNSNFNSNNSSRSSMSGVRSTIGSSSGSSRGGSSTGSAGGYRSR